MGCFAEVFANRLGGRFGGLLNAANENLLVFHRDGGQFRVIFWHQGCKQALDPF
jgi:hypothetical protein